MAYPTSCRTSCIHTSDNNVWTHEWFINCASSASPNTLNDVVSFRFSTTFSTGRHASDPNRASFSPEDVKTAQSPMGADNHCFSCVSFLLKVPTGTAHVDEGTALEPKNLFLQRIKRLFRAWKILVGEKTIQFFIIISAAISNLLGC